MRYRSRVTALFRTFRLSHRLNIRRGRPWRRCNLRYRRLRETTVGTCYGDPKVRIHLLLPSRLVRSRSGHLRLRWTSSHNRRLRRTLRLLNLRRLALRTLSLGLSRRLRIKARHTVLLWKITRSFCPEGRTATSPSSRRMGCNYQDHERRDAYR